MKKLLTRQINVGFLFLSLLAPCILSGPSYAQDPGKKVTVLEPVGPVLGSGQGIRLRIRILPPPSAAHPEHLHLYVDGRMVLMTTLTGPVLTTVLPSLSRGRHEVIIVEADFLTHREGKPADSSSMGDMAGMEMSGTDKMKNTRKHTSLARLILIVKGRSK